MCVRYQMVFVLKLLEFINNLCIPSAGRVLGLKTSAGRGVSTVCCRHSSKNALVSEANLSKTWLKGRKNIVNRIRSIDVSGI